MTRAEQSRLIGKLARALKAAEWQGEGGYSEASACVECKEYPERGHQPDCAVGKLLSLPEVKAHLKDDA